jgi:hypothetical protein
MNITLSPEHAAILGAALPGDTVHVVVAGECTDRSFHSECTDDCDRRLPPAEWQQASEPCPSCSGRGWHLGGGRITNQQVPCQYCIDGKQRVTLGFWSNDGLCLDCGASYSLPLEMRCENHDPRPIGFLALATATVEVLPVHGPDGRSDGMAHLFSPHEGFWVEARDDGSGFWAYTAPITLHRTPTPGEDIVAAVTIVDT